MLQGISTLAARLLPGVDALLPWLLAATQMMPLHSVLHIATAALAAFSLVRSETAKRFFALLFGLFYLVLGFVGALSGKQLGLGLQTFDHPFHLLLGGLGVLAFCFGRGHRPLKRELHNKSL